MKALLFSDLHTSYKNLQNIKNFVIDPKNQISLIVFAGDVVNLGEPVGFMNQFIDVIEETMLPLVWVPGNNDFGRSYYKLCAKWPSVEGKIFEFNLSKDKNAPKLIRFTGVGGSPASWSGQYAGESMIDSKKIGGTIFISHYPPPGVRTYVKYDSGYSPIGKLADAPHSHGEVGSVSDGILNQVQDDRPIGRRFSDSPLVHICSHLHHRWGISHLGTTKVVQLAATEVGYYATMDLDTLQIEFKRFENGII